MAEVQDTKTPVYLNYRTGLKAARLEQVVQYTRRPNRAKLDSTVIESFLLREINVTVSYIISILPFYSYNQKDPE